jgi:hypothetical protein
MFSWFENDRIIISAGISNEKFRLMDSYMALDTKQYLVDSTNHGVNTLHFRKMSTTGIQFFNFQ